MDKEDPGVQQLIDMYEAEVGEKLNLDLVIEKENEEDNK